MSQDYLSKLSQSLAFGYAVRLDGALKTSLKPKPKWLPMLVYLWIVRRFLKIEVKGPNVTLIKEIPNA